MKGARQFEWFIKSRTAAIAVLAIPGIVIIIIMASAAVEGRAGDEALAQDQYHVDPFWHTHQEAFNQTWYNVTFACTHSFQYPSQETILCNSKQ